MNTPDVRLIIAILTCVLLGAAGQITLKLGASAPAPVRTRHGQGRFEFVIGALTSPRIIAGLIFYAISNVLWLQILARTPLSFAYSCTSKLISKTPYKLWPFRTTMPDGAS